MEYHVGKLRRVQLKENQNLDDFCKEKLAERNITELEDYYQDWKEAFKDEYREEYFIVNGVIWEVFDHVEDDDYNDIYKITDNKDGTYSFIMKFYNGGTCLTECMEEQLEKIK